MKCVLRMIVPGLILVALLGSPALGQTRIGTVNLRKLFDSYWKRKDAEAALHDREAEMQKELEGRLKDFNNAKDEYQKLLQSAYDQSLSAEERNKRKKSAEDKLKSLKEMEDELNKMNRAAVQERDERRKRVRDNLLNDINVVITAKAKQAGYSLVIDTEGETINGTKVVLYSTGENDITKEIADQLNIGAPADSSKTDDKKEEKKPEKTDDKKKGSKK
jgi:Skp family chaperone for outer membrane proteins